jgi:hypothetical protein
MKTTMLLIAALALAACSSGNAAPPSVHGLALQTLGEVADAVDEARNSPVPEDRMDTDGDSIPDIVEAELGTDPNDPDSDRDGLVDNFELFGTNYDPAAPLPDGDRDGLINPVDNDDNGDFVNDGESVDTDGDGVPNYLEYYGYGYDFLTGRFTPWSGDPAEPHFFTDPLQASTDQDAYPDGMEVSGLNLDPTVTHPGDDPLVPAYPNLVCELASYSLTLDETLTLSETESVERGRSWTRQTDRTHAYTSEINWGVGVKAGFEAGAKEAKVTGEVSANLGGSYSSTNSVSVSVGTGESITTAEGWSVARTTNPAQAARLKLFLKIRNRGTAPISSLVPTLTLKIGGLNVTTFEPGNPQVHLLVPGETYPAEPGVYWVVDSISGGGPLTLTMTELRALERGAPISVSLTQARGDAMRLSSEGGWESIGAAAEFVARCDAVCANLRIELGNGELVHQLVYGDDGPSTRPMTLGAALGLIGVDEEGTLSYIDDEGTPRTQSLDGFKYAVDPATLRANGWEVDPDGTATPPEDFVLRDLRLLPDTNIVIRAPRDPGLPPEPEVHFAYLDAYTGEVKVSAADYEGILEVVVRNENASQVVELFEDVPGAGFFSGFVGGEDGFDADETLYAEVTNLAGLVRTIELGELFQAPEPQAPIINKIDIDLNAHHVYANVESGNPNNANSDIEWVRLYHPQLPGGFVAIEDRVFDYYQDENGLEATLPPTFQATSDLKVVVYVSPGVYTEQDVAPGDVTLIEVRHIGSVTMRSDWDDGKAVFASRIGRLTLDVPKGSSTYRFTESQNNNLITQNLHPIPGPHVDLVLRTEPDGQLLIPKIPAQMYFNAQHAYVGDGDSLYRSLTKGEIENAMFVGTSPLKVDALGGLEKNQVYAIRTTRGLYAKIYVQNIVEEYYYLQRTKIWKVVLKYAVFEP